MRPEEFHAYKKNTEFVAKLCFNICEAIAEKGKVYSDSLKNGWKYSFKMGLRRRNL